MPESYETYQPYARQQEFHNIVPVAPILVKGAIGGLFGGKTRACEEEQILICMKTPGGTSYAGRSTMSRSEKSLIEDYKKLTRGHAEWQERKGRFLFSNGHSLYVAPADKWDRFGSIELVSFYLQEAQETSYAVFDGLLQRLGRAPEGVVEGVSYYRGFFDARGVRKTHWLWSEFATKAWNIDDGQEARAIVERPDFAYVRFRTKDNPSQSTYYKQMKELHKGNLAWQKMMLEGEFGFDVEGTPVYECFNPDRHVAEIREDPTLPVLRGVDFGYLRPAVLWCQYLRDGRFVVLRELCPDGASRDDLVRQVRALEAEHFPRRHPSQYRDFGDIAGEQANSTGQTDIDYWEQSFGTSMESRKARIRDGIEVVRRLMTTTTKKGEPRFAVDYRCTRLVEALSGAYFFKIGKNDKIEDKGEGYVDISDALRYVAQLTVEEGFAEDAKRESSFAIGAY